ncbi:MAG: selenocysteine synthase [Bryobacteraceae bacterium]|nr:selenocysteine synthase [Bryobacteraceae bacterium]
MSQRRSFLQRMAALPILGGLAGQRAMVSAASAPARDVIKELGVRTFINAAGTYTALTASLMRPEVVAAMAASAKHFVPLGELQDKVGAKIASMLGAEAAIVTSGAAGALTIGTAACITGADMNAVRQIPDLTGLKSEVIVQKSHRYGYDHAVRTCGVRLVEVETAQELESAVNSKTAMMLFFNDADPKGAIKAEQFVALGKKHNIPTFIDASADVPPVTNLTRYTKMGFDLVTFSGGKGIRGPQSAGILAGRKDLVAAARLNTSPNSDSIARGMKVNKEEMIGMLVALQAFTSIDHAAEWKDWEARVGIITDAVRKLPSVTTEVSVPEIANHTPHLHIRWDQAKIAISPPEVMKRLREGTPSIEACPATDREQLVFTVWMLQPGEEKVVARRVREIMTSV